MEMVVSAWVSRWPNRVAGQGADSGVGIGVAVVQLDREGVDVAPSAVAPLSGCGDGEEPRPFGPAAGGQAMSRPSDWSEG